jgi:hypothetical protein
MPRTCCNQPPCSLPLAAPCACPKPGRQVSQQHVAQTKNTAPSCSVLVTFRYPIALHGSRYTNHSHSPTRRLCTTTNTAGPRKHHDAHACHGKRVRVAHVAQTLFSEQAYVSVQRLAWRLNNGHHCSVAQSHPRATGWVNTTCQYHPITTSADSQESPPADS